VSSSHPPVSLVRVARFVPAAAVAFLLSLGALVAEVRRQLGLDRNGIAGWSHGHGTEGGRSGECSQATAEKRASATHHVLASARRR
jgi:transposase-like protein